jgi:hypothetical protein
MCLECDSKFTFIILVIIVIIILYLSKNKENKNSEERKSGFDNGSTIVAAYPFNMDVKKKTLYSGVEVDPIITGGLYQGRDCMRPVYGTRTADGDQWGLHPYCSSLPEVAGEQTLFVDQSMKDNDSKPGIYYDIPESVQSGCYDDGMPTNWNLPSTPIVWYKPLGEDYYGKEGITPYKTKLVSQSEPDHDPDIGEDTEYPENNLVMKKGDISSA